MSGIAGIFSFEAPVVRDALGRFIDALAHRGPDGRGLVLDRKLGLGHRRLTVFDPSRHGRCPMPYEDSQAVATKAKWRGQLAALTAAGCEDAALTPYRYWLTFDGEIYNFPELRRELSAMGYRFRSTSDAEVVLAAYAQWGEACLPRFNGCWAFALWDRQERTLLLARDRFGERPLFYVHSPARLAFASETKAFLALEGFHPALHADLVPRVLENPEALQGTTDETLLAGVRRLPAGHVARVTSDGALHVRRWWETNDHLPEAAPQYEEHVAQFRELFLDSVRLRLRSDLRLGTRLNGSFAANALVGAAAELERTNADLARVPRDRHQQFAAEEPEAALRDIANAAWSAEEVSTNPAAPAWCFYRAVRAAGTTVSFESHGAEALLGGQPRDLDWFMAQVNPNLAHEYHATLFPAFLREIDACAMAHGVAVRSPFLDWRLVTFTQALPATSKFGGGYTQRVLRDAMKNIVPEDARRLRIRARGGPSMAEWFNGGLAPVLRQLVNHPRWRESPHWDGPALRQMILAKSEAGAWSAHDEAEIGFVWTRLSLVLWELLFIDRVRPEAVFR